MTFFLSSCGRYNQIPYFQDLKLNGPVQEEINNLSAQTIQKDDVLGIIISSSSAEASAVFNNKLTRLNNNNDDVSSANPINPYEGYLVDSSGEIQFPVLGALKVAGLTTPQLRKMLTDKLNQYLKNPVVIARIINMKVSVLGDVAKPDIYPIKSERITVLEALALAGDLNITAKRKTVILIREQDGKRAYIPIDLNAKALFKSDYYYLKSNDVIYVQPDKTKYAPYDIGYRNATLIVAALSVLVIGFSTIYR
ncbi:polysaccharide biosynthesis/export family protein [Pedobacter alpinus]|uniref:polysaccharide biosynthesis/export family protein n=1 Tax=Pedobacter alpinus TaxID=1590643 RepID=UPI003672C24B